MRLQRTLPLLFLPLVAVACGDVGVRALPEFCREVLPRVAEFTEGFEHPAGERYGGAAVVGAIGEIPGGMNAFQTVTHEASQHQIFLHLMPLVRMNEDLELVPWLARAWEVGEDGTEITFHLRDDVYWHDGTLTTAWDVAFTYERVTDPETAFPNAAYWSRYHPGPEGLEVVDSFTVRVGLDPHPEFMDAWRAVAIMPRHLLEDVPPAELRGHPFGTRCPVGNGPFVFAEHRQDESWTFTRNPAFPRALGGPPYLDRYVYRVVPEPTTLLAELLTENLDVYVAPTPDQIPRILEADNAELLDFPFRSYVFVAWNHRRPQLSDARVRRAIAMGTNRREMVEAFRGDRARIANAGVPPFHWAYDEIIEDALPYDPEGARRLLEEAGWVDRTGDGVREDSEGNRLAVTLLYNQGERERQEMAEIMQAQLREIGMEVTPRSMEWAAVTERLLDTEERPFDGIILSWITEFKVDDHDLVHSTKVDQPYQFAGIQNPRLDRLLDTLQVVLDRDEALPLWQEYQELLLELQPFTYFFFPNRTAGVGRRIEGVEMDVRGEWVSVTQWWIPEDRRRGRSR